MKSDEVFGARASKLLGLVLAQLDEGARADVRELLRAAAERGGVHPRVEQLARDAWEAQAALARPEEARANAPRMVKLALTQAALLLRAGERVAA